MESGSSAAVALGTFAGKASTVVVAHEAGVPVVAVRAYGTEEGVAEEGVTTARSCHQPFDDFAFAAVQPPRLPSLVLERFHLVKERLVHYHLASAVVDA